LEHHQRAGWNVPSRFWRPLILLRLPKLRHRRESANCQSPAISMPHEHLPPQCHAGNAKPRRRLHRRSRRTVGWLAPNLIMMGPESSTQLPVVNLRKGAMSVYLRPGIQRRSFPMMSVVFVRSSPNKSHRDRPMTKQRMFDLHGSSGSNRTLSVNCLALSSGCESRRRRQ
jgi:hypothetical protein